MNRRVMIAGSLAATIAGQRFQGYAQESTPAADDRIELAPGFFLHDYRFEMIAGGAIPAFLGEYVNETGETFDTPVLGITFYDADDNIVGSHYATPVVPITHAGQRVPVTGEFYEFDPLTDPYDRVEYTLCDDLTGSFHVDQEAALDVELDDVEETLGDDDYLIEGKIQNNRDAPVEGVGVTVIFRDEDELFVGYTWTVADRAIPAGRSFAFSADVNFNTFVPFDSFDRSDGAVATEIVLGPFAGGYGINCR